MNAVYRHVTLCLLTGLVTMLPIGGTVILVFAAENFLRPLVPARLYFPGVGLISVLVLLYLLGVTLTTFLGRWLWNRLDIILSRLPGLGMLYRSLKQILGFDAGEGALFQRVVLVPDEGTGGAEIGFVTTVEGDGEGKRLVVFLPGSPNPAQGRLLRLPTDRVLPTDWSIDQALKGLLSLGRVY
jgi:uncharacterized membrane protein